MRGLAVRQVLILRWPRRICATAPTQGARLSLPLGFGGKRHRGTSRGREVESRRRARGLGLPRVGNDLLEEVLSLLRSEERPETVRIRTEHRGALIRATRVPRLVRTDRCLRARQTRFRARLASLVPTRPFAALGGGGRTASMVLLVSMTLGCRCSLCRCLLLGRRGLLLLGLEALPVVRDVHRRVPELVRNLIDAHLRNLEELLLRGLVLRGQS